METKNTTEVPEELRERLAVCLTKKLEERGMGFNQLSVKAEINPSVLTKIMQGTNKRINPYQLQKIAYALKIDYRDLYRIVGYLESNMEDENEVKEKKIKELPVFGSISAGFGRIAYNDVVDYYTLDSDIKNADQLIAFKVSGDSMGNKIPDGSQVLIRRGVEVENNEIGVFCVGEECFVKQLKVYSGTVLLRSLNPAYEDIEITEDTEFQVVGKVIECKTKFSFLNN